MASYWVFLNDEVAGPYALEQLIRVRGFSRQTLVCIDDGTGKPTHWISPAEIPELAHIFKAVEEHLARPVSATARPAPKPAPARPPRPYTPAVTLRAPSRSWASLWLWALVAALFLSGGVFSWLQYAQRGNLAREQVAARSLVENAPLPAPSPYGTLRQYIEEKNLKTRWEFERMQDALYHVTLSWYAPSLAVYAFEANVQAQTVRGLNTAATQLLSEGFPAPHAARPKTAPAPKKSPTELFSQAIDGHREALENGDFSTVWNSFSQRKKSEMGRGGISRDGFVRLQSLTHHVESAMKLTVLKTKPESDTEMLVLLKQTQTGRPDIFVKQLWVFEGGTWKLDDEQKKTASAAPAPTSAPAAPAANDSANPATPKPSPDSLPGMAH